MKKILAFTLAILLVLPGFMAWGQSDEGYGEEETALGQFVDSFETSGNISVTVNVIRNATLEAMELNFTLTGSPIDENYTEYTEFDANNRFTVTDTTITVESLRNTDDHHYIVFDYGPGYFTDFTHDLEARARDNSGSSGNDRMWVWLLANVSDESIDMINNNEELIGLYFQEFDLSDPDQPDMTLREYENGVLFLDRWEGGFRDVWYYFRIVKTGVSLTCGIYSTAVLRDAGDGTDGDLDNLALTLHGDYNFRYIYAVAGLNDGTPTVRIISGDIANLTIGRSSSGFASEGYFTTVDYLSDPLANGSALVAMVVSDIPANTDIQLQFSNDTVIWTDHEGVPGDSVDLLGGRESIDLRLLNHSNAIQYRFNLSTSDSSVTPRVNQSRLITMIGQGAGPGNLLNGSWVDYNLTEIGVTRGTLDSGNLASTYFIDGDMFNVSEVAMTPRNEDFSQCNRD